jgi:DNA mismatch repair protein MutS
MESVTDRGRPAVAERVLETPLRRQYLQLKRRYPDTILLFRLGDFYEAFDDDAKTISAALDIVLTGRDGGRGQRIPMAGVPYHALDAHLAKLVRRGYRVAVCEQLSDPRTSKGLVDRDVTRIVTPGTVVEPAMLDDKRNLYLAALVAAQTRRADDGAGSSYGLSYVDVSTGEFATTQIRRDETHVLERELERIGPAELVVPADSEVPVLSSPAVLGGARVTRLDTWRVNLSAARETLCRHFGISSPESLGCADQPLAIQAAAVIVQYLGETRRSALGQLTELRTYDTSGYMLLDASTRRNLEISERARGSDPRGSLLWFLDRTRTPGGGRLLRTWLSQPLVDLDKLNARLDAVGELVEDTGGRARLREQLSVVRDLERLINRIGQGIATPRDLVALNLSLRIVPTLATILNDHGGPGGTKGRRRELASELDSCPEIVELIQAAIVDEPPATLADGGFIRQGYSPELDDIQRSTEHARRWIENLEPVERERTGIRSLKVGYNRVFGYYLEVSNANRDLVPASYIRKQTLVGAERYVTPELKEYETLVLNARERIVEAEQALFRQICAQIVVDRTRITQTAKAIARIDALSCFAEVAVQDQLVRPLLDESTTIHIVGGRHPVVESVRPDEPFTPNDVELSGEGAQIVLLTGPNMAGKSTYLRQVALSVLLAQIGCYVPAESARIGLVDRIFTRVGAQDDLAAGQSTFLVEMLETANLLIQSTRRSLLILDEVGRGTSTYDGLAIAQAIVEYIHNHPRLGARTLFATHFHELTNLASVLPRVRNYRMDVREEGNEVHFLHRVVPGGADRSYGIHVARLAGIPRAVTRRAEEILKDLERKGRRSTARRDEPEVEVIQLAFLGEPDPVVEELRSLDVLSLTPIEAIQKLFELQRRATNGSSDAKSSR